MEMCWFSLPIAIWDLKFKFTVDHTYSFNLPHSFQTLSLVKGAGGKKGTFVKIECLQREAAVTRTAGVLSLHPLGAPLLGLNVRLSTKSLKIKMVSENLVFQLSLRTFVIPPACSTCF